MDVIMPTRVVFEPSGELEMSGQVYESPNGIFVIDDTFDGNPKITPMAVQMPSLGSFHVKPEIIREIAKEAFDNFCNALDNLD